MPLLGAQFVSGLTHVSHDAAIGALTAALTENSGLVLNPFPFILQTSSGSGGTNYFPGFSNTVYRDRITLEPPGAPGPSLDRPKVPQDGLYLIHLSYLDATASGDLYPAIFTQSGTTVTQLAYTYMNSSNNGAKFSLSLEALSPLLAGDFVYVSVSGTLSSFNFATFYVAMVG